MFCKLEVYEFCVSGNMLEKKGNPRKLRKKIVTIDILLESKQRCMSETDSMDSNWI